MAATSRKRRPVISPVQWATLILVALFVIVPFYTTALGGFKEIGELRVNPFGLPASWDPVRFVEILGEAGDGEDVEWDIGRAGEDELGHGFAHAGRDGEAAHHTAGDGIEALRARNRPGDVPAIGGHGRQAAAIEL